MSVDVAVTELRAHLRHWIESVRDGNEVVITDHGLPVARIIGVDTTAALERLVESGVIAKPAERGRPRATGRQRPVPRRQVSDRVTEQRG